MNPLPEYDFCDRECATGPSPCGPCARERAWVAEAAGLRAALERIARFEESHPAGEIAAAALRTASAKPPTEKKP